MNIRLSIDTDDRWLAFDLMGSSTVGEGTATAISDGATLTVAAWHFRKALGLPETLELVLSFGTGVASGLVANWLFGKLKGRNATLRIEEQWVEIEEDEIKRIISRVTERQE